MKFQKTRVIVLSSMLVGSVCLAASATSAASAASEVRSSAAAVNLGGGLDGGYVDDGGQLFTGEGAIVVDIDGAFTAGNTAFVGADGKSKIAGEACIGQELGSTPFPSLCDTTTVVSSSAPANDPMYFSMLAGASQPSDSPVSSCSDAGDFCHNYHGTATAGAIVGQPGVRYESGEKLHTAGAAVGARVFQIKVGGGDSSNGRQGWPHESVVDALYWVNKVLSERPVYKGRIAAVNLSVSGAPLAEGTACGPAGMAIDAAAALLKQKGIAVVMSSGNDGINGSGDWNCGPNVIRVGATSISDPHTLTDYSNRGESVILHAPVGDGDRSKGNALLLPWKSAGTFYGSGTSYASPQIAGAFAVLREKFGAGPSVDALTNLLQRTGTPVKGTSASPDAINVNIQNALNDHP